MIRRTVWFTGRVQGVGFRYTACQIARDFPVTGYVRNLPDGRVESVIEGDLNAIEGFLRAVSDEMADCIRDSRSSDGTATGEFDGFSVRF